MHIKRMLAALLCLMMLVGCALAESTEQQPADFSEKFAEMQETLTYCCRGGLI